MPRKFASLLVYYTCGAMPVPACVRTSRPYRMHSRATAMDDRTHCPRARQGFLVQQVVLVAGPSRPAYCGSCLVYVDVLTQPRTPSTSLLIAMDVCFL